MTFEELGRSIKEKREASGMSIDDVASRIKISARILRTIEEGSLVGLPHTVYTKSFIRSFGQLVGYDPQEMHAALEEIFPPDAFDESRAESILRANPAMTYPDAGKRFAIILFFLLFFAGLIGGGWYVATRYGDQILELIKAPFSALTSPAAEQPEQRPVPSGESPGASSGLSSPGLSSPDFAPFGQAGLAERQGSARAAQPPSPPDLAAPSAHTANANAPASAGVGAFGAGPVSVAEQNPTAAVPTLEALPGAAERQSPAAALTPGELARPDGKNTLVVRATAECWIRSRTDGLRTRDHTLRPGGVFTISYDQQLEITFGNAGGVTVSHNGKNMGSPGAGGQIATLRFP